MCKLTPKQEVFCQEYLVDLNGTQSAIRAGYSSKTAREIATELLSKPHIQARLDELKADRNLRTQVDQDWVIANLIEVSQRCMQKVPVMVWDRAEKRMRQAEDDEGKGVWTFDSSGANRALELLGRHQGLFPDRKELTGKDGEKLFGSLSDSELAEQARRVAREVAAISGGTEKAGDDPGSFE